MIRFAPSAEGGDRSRKSRIVRWSRPMLMLRWLRREGRMAGELAGSGGISWAARFGARDSEGERGVGGWTWRYQGM